MMTKMLKIMIIGTGSIGKRHLQSVSNLNMAFELFCHDKFQKSIDSTKKFIDENKLNFKGLYMTTNLSSILPKIDNNTIIIVSTTADARLDILSKVISLKPKAIISEKPLSQTEKVIKNILSLSKANKVPIYCNFSNHTYPGYQELLSKIKNRSKFTFNINFERSVGFACNGIHYLETVSWFLNMKKYEILDSQLISVFDSKRKGFQDMEGSMTFVVNDKYPCTINISGKESTNSIQISTEKELITVFEMEQKIVIIDKNQKVAKKQFPILYTSQITEKIVNDIVNNQKPMLPLAEETFLAHLLLFDFMKRHNVENLNIT